jgi:hypothetical protein
MFNISKTSLAIASSDVVRKIEVLASQLGLTEKNATAGS